MMRRFLLGFTVISFAGWSQAAQQQAQSPIVVQIQTPPANPWMRLVELLIPGVIGAGLALFGAWLTNKNNAATNAANRNYQLQVEIAKAEIAANAKSRDNKFVFRKDIYIRMVTAIDLVLSANTERQRVLCDGQDAPESTQKLMEALWQFDLAAQLAPFATSDSLLKLVKGAVFSVAATTNEIEELDRVSQALRHLRDEVQAAGRKDLWGTSEPEANSGTAKQA